MIFLGGQLSRRSATDNTMQFSAVQFCQDSLAYKQYARHWHYDLTVQTEQY